MGTTLAVVFGVVAAALAGVAAWLWRGQGRLAAEAGAARREAEEAGARLAAAREAQGAAVADVERFRGMVDGLREEIGELKVAEARFAEREESLARERAQLEKRVAELREQMGETFKALAGETLRVTGDELLKRAKAQFESQQREDAAELEKRRAAVEQLVKPIGETLEATRDRLTKLDQQVLSSREASESLRSEASKLVRALSRPEVRGRYGEIQLQKVAELAGMRRYCDFTEQASSRDEEGRLLRPDVVVSLPNNRRIAIDAKTPTDAYMQAIEAETPEQAEEHLRRFTAHVEEQVKKLSDKRYWSQLEGSLDFVVMFVPGDQFVDAALARSPELLEKAAAANVILASPSTLIGLLRAVAVGWREHTLAEEAEKLLEDGRRLHKAAADAFEHVAKLGRAIDSAAGIYNKMVGSMERRMLPGLRRFEDAGVKGDKPLSEIKPIETGVRDVQALPMGESAQAREGE